MKRTIGILLLVVGVALGIYGFSKYDKNTADVKIGDLGCSIYHNMTGLRNTIVGCLEYSSP